MFSSARAYNLSKNAHRAEIKKHYLCHMSQALLLSYTWARPCENCRMGRMGCMENRPHEARLSSLTQRPVQVELQMFNSCMGRMGPMQLQVHQGPPLGVKNSMGRGF